MKFYYLKYKKDKFYGSHFRRHAWLYRDDLNEAIKLLEGTPIIHQNTEKLLKAKNYWEKLGINFTLEEVEL